MKRVFAGLIALISAFALCMAQEEGVAYVSGMYAEKSYWFDNGREIDEQKADVFYVLPTCVFDWTDSQGKVCHYASLTDAGQRKAMQPSYVLADEIFADSANFFAPYYRQITLNSWSESEEIINQRFAFAMRDVKDAFDHYMKTWNNGRPFVLAGFSQGAKCVVELIKSMDQATAENMVAAYVCGYRVTKEDIASTPFLHCATASDDTGVTIVYNSVADISAINATLSAGNEYIINPASWTTDTGFHALNDSVSIAIDAEKKVLIAKGLSPDAGYNAKLSRMFPKGNLHLLELTLYHDALRENVKRRLRSFRHRPAVQRFRHSLTDSQGRSDHRGRPDVIS